MPKPTELAVVVSRFPNETPYDSAEFLTGSLGRYPDIDLWGVLRCTTAAWSLRLMREGVVKVDRTTPINELTPDGGLAYLLSPDYRTSDPSLIALQHSERPLGRCAVLAYKGHLPFLEAASLAVPYDLSVHEIAAASVSS